MSIVRFRSAGEEWLTASSDEPADATYRFALSSRFLPGFSSRTARDLLRVGQAAFLADRALRRGQRLGQRTRDLEVVVPVEEPKRWQAFAELVGSLAGFVSHDRWDFHFVRLRDASAPGRLQKKPLPRNTCISLFSGGLDSLCGAAAAFRRDDVPIFVTHAPPAEERVASIVGRLRAALGTPDPEPRFVGFRFQASDRARGGARSLFPERSRRTRPMLYLCLAGAVAVECNVERIYLNENGVLAINLPFRPNMHGPLISRHAHPETLRRFESLLTAIWEGKGTPAVRNPFAQETKGEQIASLGPARSLAQETISCEYAGQQIARLIAWLREHRRPHKEVRECGLCYPCLVRRGALGFAGVPESGNHYAFDVRRALGRAGSYAKYPLYRFLQANPRDLREFCDAMLGMSPAEFVLRYAAQLSLIGPDAPSASRSAYDLYQRFARQLHDFLVAE